MYCSTCFISVRYAYASSELRISGSLTISISGVPRAVQIHVGVAVGIA